MDTEHESMLRRLLDTQAVAALATLHRGEPAVSMVPFVVSRGGTSIVIHVSRLATHTADMLAHPRIGLLVTADAAEGVSPQARPRVSLQADAYPLASNSEAHALARARYLERFPDSAITFELGDFSLFALHPVSARLVAGFARAHSLVGERLSSWLAEAV